MIVKWFEEVIKKHSKFKMMVNIAGDNSNVSYKYGNLLLLRENGEYYLCYRQYFESIEFESGIIYGLAFNDLGLGICISHNPDISYYDIMSGEQRIPDDCNEKHYLDEIIAITDGDINNKELNLSVDTIVSALNTYNNVDRIRKLCNN